MRCVAGKTSRAWVLKIHRLIRCCWQQKIIT